MMQDCCYTNIPKRQSGFCVLSVAKRFSHRNYDTVLFGASIATFGAVCCRYLQTVIRHSDGTTSRFSRNMGNNVIYCMMS